MPGYDMPRKKNACPWGEGSFLYAFFFCTSIERMWVKFVKKGLNLKFLKFYGKRYQMPLFGHDIVFDIFFC